MKMQERKKNSKFRNENCCKNKKPDTMKAMISLLICLTLLSTVSFGQKKVYFDNNWLNVEKSEATYYSLIYPIKGGKYQVKDYTISGELLSETEYSRIANEIVWERLYEEGFHDLAIEDGKCIEYYPNGNRKRMFTYEKGKQEGNVRLWDEDGKLFRDFVASKHIANGLYLEYYQNGKASLSVNFKNDTLNGPAAYYHSNGKVSQRGNFKNGKKVGKWTYWSDRGELTGKESYQKSFFIEGPDIQIAFPKGNWCLTDQFKEEEIMHFLFARNGESQNLISGVTPNCILSMEYIGADQKLLDYSSYKRRRLTVDIHKVIAKEQELFSLENSMGYLGSYSDDQKKKHTVIVFHTIQNEIGVEMIMDIREEDYESLKKEAVQILRSIKK
ncbi:toxin-antitoxin system YwqK family antitoxin [Marinifilum sp. JC070]|uniref:Toxin-antitoxin system YwqK family antitoxin n=2 Tax=Marinifilum caeruleilacunae TaxID=2499076 RepID=A0ABX1WRQ1_9BACT|nr:toxin-antitoxin system YwqK family antitoxin [Marinifilum caeruleilacunae]